MYAVYGLTEDRSKIEKFLGYTPASFFESFTDPEKWSVKVIDLPDGTSRVGRAFGRAFFVFAGSLKANADDIMSYMGIKIVHDEGSDTSQVDARESMM